MINYLEQTYFVVDTVINLFITVFFFYKAIATNSYWYILLSAYGEYKLGYIGHEGCHGAIPKIYKYLFDLILGSSEQWSMKHNKGHHIHTNKEKDPDVDLMPFMRLKDYQPLKWYHRYQHIYQYFLFPFAIFRLRGYGIIYLYKKYDLRRVLLQLVVYIPGIYLFIIYPMRQHGGWGLIFYLLHNMYISFAFGVIFSISHVNSKSKFDEKETNFEQIQLNETADWCPGSYIANYLTGGLNHQVVHHLHPRISSYHYPRMMYEIKKKYGSKYNRFDSFFDIIKSNYLYMRKMGSVR